jgi:peptidoglycan-associated lipoprotein
MKALKVVGLVFLAATLTGAVGGCGQSHQAVKGGSVSPAQSAAMTQKPAPSATARQGAEKEISTSPLGEASAMTALKDIHYDFDKYDIRPQDAEILKQNYTWLMQNPGTRVRIEGNCDERGTVEYNMVLGQKRADSAKSFLMTLGIGKGSIETISYGKERPVDPGHDEQAWAKNRRSHFVPLK